MTISLRISDPKRLGHDAVSRIMTAMTSAVTEKACPPPTASASLEPRRLEAAA